MRNKIDEILKKIISEPIKIVIEVPESDAFGHYSTNMAFAIGKIWKMAPMDAAIKLREKIIEQDSEKMFAKIDIAKPGFINFWISNDKLDAELKEILLKKKNYGAIPAKNATKEKTQIEFMSANPTGPLTMANGRGGFLGDVLSNILEFTGQKIEREYYVNDTGNQIITLGNSLMASLGLISDDEKYYRGSYIKTWASKNKTFIIKNKNSAIKIGKKAALELLKDIKKIIKNKSGINFDRFTSEDANIHKKGFIGQAMTIFESKKLTYEKDGATWLKTTDFGDDKDRVLITSDGFPTYFLADSGHMLETKTRGFVNKILILGPDHYGYVARIKASAIILGLSNLKILVTQAVRVIKDGIEIKMSKRKGEFITFEEVISEVGEDATRFFFLMHAPESHMDFDLKLAKEKSVKNPVFYVQYAYVRCGAILKKVKANKFSAGSSRKESSVLTSETGLRLLRELIKFKDVIEDISKDYQVHSFTRYASELSHVFHNFYEKERIVGEKNGELIASRLKLVLATQIVLGGALDLLGINKPKKM